MIKKQFLIPKGASENGTPDPCKEPPCRILTITISISILLNSSFTLKKNEFKR